MDGTRHVGDCQRSARAAPSIGAREVVFHSPIDGKHVRRRPARIAECRPRVEIGRLSAHVNHGVDRARAADDAAARPIGRSPAGAVIGFGLVTPIEFRMVEGLAVADRHPDPEIEVGTARLEQQHPHRGIGAQPVGENATGRTRADDDKVKKPIGRHFSLPNLIPLPAKYMVNQLSTVMRRVAVHFMHDAMPFRIIRGRLHFAALRRNHRTGATTSTPDRHIVAGSSGAA